MTHSKVKTEQPVPGREQASAIYAKADKLKTSDGDIDALIVREVGGRDGPDPTRYGDWEKNGRCVDF